MSEERSISIKEQNMEQKMPDVLLSTLPHINNIISMFNLPRKIIASNEEIICAWRELPREINRIPSELRNELVARMCLATSVGLFDGAVNYMWNAVIINLKLKAKNFGLGIIAKTLNKKFEENDLNDLMDAELLDICYKLELLSQEGYFFLSQCRDIRNSFSSAHPSISNIDDRELINFISRCCKYGITSDYNLRGIRIADLILSIKSRKFDELQINEWANRLENTFPAQRQLLFPMLYGIYCDPSSNESSRLNALKICTTSIEFLDERIKSSLIEQHNKYLLKGDEDSVKASWIFFEKLGLLEILSNSEQHSIIKNACTNLTRVHLAYDNFYNETPFAERLSEIVSAIKIPDTVKEEFVTTVVTCYIGNQYGICRAAVSDYETMIRNFTPKEIGVLLRIPHTKTIVADRISTYGKCKNNYVTTLQLLDPESLTSSQKTEYAKYLKGRT